ncbi:MAG: hypothetical protein ACKOBW_12675 [Planctomycetota bacterium]
MNQHELKAATGRRPVLGLCLLLLSLVGCHGKRVAEAEHHTPEHMPADYPAAVDRLLAVHAEIANGGARAAEQIDVFAETYDIVRWLPMLAADSDLAEELWNQVHAASQRLEVILTAVLARHGNDRRGTYLQSETELTQLQRELVEVQRRFPTAPHALTAD